ncbi:MAG: phytoene/squalene synthase family protein [Rhodospirillales bacterium]
MQRDEAFSACARMVRSEDRDRFLCAMFAPANRRGYLFALYAFNLEIARVREIVSEPLIGRMRLQWWRDALDSIYRGTGPNNPVARAVAETVAACPVSRGHFETLIDGREADMQDEPFETLNELIAYAEGTSVPLVRLSLEALGVSDERSHAAARGVGTAWALSGLMRAIPFHRAGGRSYLPKDLCRDFGFAAGAISHAHPPVEFRAVVAAICSVSRQALHEARRYRKDVPRQAIAALLPAVLAESYLTMLEKAGHNPFDPTVQRLRPSGLLKLSYTGIRGSY